MHKRLIRNTVSCLIAGKVQGEFAAVDVVELRSGLDSHTTCTVEEQRLVLTVCANRWWMSFSLIRGAVALLLWAHLSPAASVRIMLNHEREDFLKRLVNFARWLECFDPLLRIELLVVTQGHDHDTEVVSWLSKKVISHRTDNRWTIIAT